MTKKKTEKLATGLTLKRYEFNENNSGGEWWLGKKQYERLFKNGWKLDEESAKAYKDDNPLDTKDVPWAWRHNLYFEAYSIRDAVESWENATGKDFFTLGCTCCGAPFSISGGGEYLSGSSVEQVPLRPW